MRHGILYVLAAVHDQRAEVGAGQDQGRLRRRAARAARLLKSGHVEMLLAQDCYGWGTKSVEIPLEKIVSQKDPPQPRVIDPLTAVAKENADEFGKKWEKWLGGR